MNITEHHIHHLDARVPCYNLRACHVAIGEEVWKKAGVHSLGSAEVREALGLALWDEEREAHVPFPPLFGKKPSSYSSSSLVGRLRSVVAGGKEREVEKFLYIKKIPHIIFQQFFSCPFPALYFSFQEHQARCGNYNVCDSHEGRNAPDDGESKPPAGRTDLLANVAADRASTTCSLLLRVTATAGNSDPS